MATTLAAGPLLLALLFGPGLPRQPYEARSPKAFATRLQAVLASKEMAVVRRAERAYALPVRDLLEHGGDVAPSSPGVPGRFVVLPEAVALGDDDRQALAAALTSPRSYQFGTSKCGFQPGVAFRFGSGEEAVDAVVCFKCNELIFTRGDALLIDRLDFEPSRPLLLRVARAAFPGNTALQDLK